MAAHKNRTFDRELQLMAKRANQRMVELERQGIKSPAYQHIQAVLSAEGRKTGANRGRRFSETGKGTFNQIQHQKALLRRFLNQQTSKLTGAKKYRRKVEETIENKYHLEEAGFDFGDFVKAMEKLADSEASRVFGSDIVVKIITTVHRQQNEGILEQEFTTDEIMETIEGSKSLKSALSHLGLTFADLEGEDLGAL